MAKVTIERLLTQPELYIIRVEDAKIRFFEAVWEIPEGVTYNSYLLKLGNEAILFDTCKDEYSKELLEGIKSLVKPEEITHIVLHHLEPDHSGALPMVLEENKHKARVIVSHFGSKLVEAFYGVTDNITPVGDGENINIGGRSFKFITTPWLHWPDTMITYLPEDGLAFTNDVGGGYSIPPAIDDSDESVVESYLPHVTKYLVTVIGHFKDYIPKHYDKLSQTGVIENVKMILPGHGLIFRKNPRKILDHYLRVSKGVARKGKVLVVYDSMYGFLEKSIQVALNEINRLGGSPLTYRFTDTESANIGDILKDVPDSEGVVIGVSAYEASIHPQMRLVISAMIEKTNYDKPILLIGAYGWGGVGEKTVKAMLQGSNLRLMESIEFKGRPSPETEDRIRSAVRSFLAWT